MVVNVCIVSELSESGMRWPASCVTSAQMPKDAPEAAVAESHFWAVLAFRYEVLLRCTRRLMNN